MPESLETAANKNDPGIIFGKNILVLSAIVIETQDTRKKIAHIWVENFPQQFFYGVNSDNPNKVTIMPKYDGAAELREALKKYPLPLSKSNIEMIKFINIQILKILAQVIHDIIETEEEVTPERLLSHPKVHEVLPIISKK